MIMKTTIENYHPFLTLLAVVGTPTRDNRLIAETAVLELAKDAPVREMSSPGLPYSVSMVGVLAALWRREHEVFAFGVAVPEIAAELNSGTLVLGMDLDATDHAEVGGQILLRRGTVRGATLREAGDFAWS
jgi:hypothetical protein